MRSYLSATGWTINVYPEPGKPTFRVRAISPSRKACINRERLSETAALAFDPLAVWASPVARAPRIFEPIAQLLAG